MTLRRKVSQHPSARRFLEEALHDIFWQAVFPWSIKMNGEDAHTFNANRISFVVPRPGEIEHWTIVNGGGGWDHPIHLHFEEGVTIRRGRDPIPGDRTAGEKRRLAAGHRR
jgi:hypothetical protein